MELTLKERNNRGESGNATFALPRRFKRQLEDVLVRSARISQGHRPWSNYWLEELSIDESIKDLVSPIEFDLEDFLFSVMDLRLKDRHWRQIKRALVYSAFMHKDQIRSREKLPYLVHILRVSRRVADFLMRLHEEGIKMNSAKKRDLIISALLHDSVEDHALSIVRYGFDMSVHVSNSCARGLALDVVERHFGSAVRLWVSTLSKPLWEKDNDKEKQESYQEWIRHIWQDGDFENTIIKLADIFDNLDSTLKDLKDIAERKMRYGRLSKEDIAAKRKNNELVIKYLSILLALKENYSRWISNEVLKNEAIMNMVLEAIDKRKRAADNYFSVHGLKDRDLLEHLRKFQEACK